MPQPEESVSIAIEYPDQDQADVKVDPGEVTIYYNRKGGPGDSKLARKVRWEVEGVHKGDHVVVRPKESLDEWTRTIFVPPAGKKHFEVTSEDRSVVCGPPVFGVDPGAFPIRWEYEAVVIRKGKMIGSCDPIVLIDKDP